MKCKACDATMGEVEIKDRIVTDECGDEHVVMEDLCRKCREVANRIERDNVLLEIDSLLNKLDELEDVGD